MCFFLAALALAACSASSPRRLVVLPADAPSSPAAGNHTIEQLDDAAHVLRFLADGESSLKGCPIEAEEAKKLLLPLHAMIDEKIAEEKSTASRRNFDRCEAGCHCGIYSDLAEAPAEKTKLYNKARRLSRKKLLSCAKKSAPWFCGSTLLQKLKADAHLSDADGL